MGKLYALSCVLLKKVYYFCNMFGSNGNSRFGSMPPVTKNLLLINFLIWGVEIIFPQFADRGLIRHLGLHYVDSDFFNPIQIVTYMFVHSNSSFTHILFNMFSLWMFGRTLEMIWGSRRFLLFYMICGVGAALVQEFVWTLSWSSSYIDGIARLNGLTSGEMQKIVEQSISSGSSQFLEGMANYRNQFVTIGASGAVFGLLLGFAFVFPNMPMYLFFIPVPIKAKYMVAGYAVLEFFLGIGPVNDTVAHFAHLGGLLFGLIVLLYWKRKGILRGGRF